MSSSSFKLDEKIVRAGAGAGKTTRLTENIYLSVINFHRKFQRWPRLVVTTFTRKATQELRERLIVKACDEGHLEFLDYINSGSNIHISTIHGVLNLFLRNYGHLLGWDNSFQLMSLREAQTLAKSILKNLDNDSRWDFWLENYTYKELLQLLLTYYEMRWTYPQGRPASASLLKACVQNHFNEQQRELCDLGSYILDNFEEEKWVEFGRSLMAAPTENLQEFVNNLTAKPRKTKRVDPQADEEVKERFDNIKKNLDKSGLTDAEIKRASQFYEGFYVLAEDFTQHFLHKKKLISKLEMRDLELLSKIIIEQEPSLAKTFSAEWDYWLIDEYQDTSPLQEELLRQFIGQSPCYIVGDPQQSVYLFRGARSEVFARKEKEFTNKQEVLKKNYRSQPNLLAFINDFFSGYEQSFLKMDESDKWGDIAEDRTVVQFYNGNEYHFVCSEVLKLLEHGTQPENICVLARKNQSLGKMASFLNAFHIPTHVYASGGFYQRREILDVLSLVKFVVNKQDNENLISLLRSPWLAVVDQQLMSWTENWSSSRQSFWQFIKSKDHEAILQLKGFINKCHKEGIFAATLYYLKEWQVLTYSHYHDASGRRESNLWKLITYWQEQEKKPNFNIYHFLNQTQNDLSESEGNEEADAVAALEPSCVNLMTIHASKGLQFEHVFIIDCGKAPQLSGGAKENNRIHYDEETQAWSFALPAEDDSGKIKSILDHKYIERMHERELEESDRLFYVAVTRAIKNVYISWSDKIHEQSWLGRSHYKFKLGQTQRQGYAIVFDNQDIPTESLKHYKKETSVPTLVPLSYQSHNLQPLTQISVTQYLERSSQNNQNTPPSNFHSPSLHTFYEGMAKAQLGTDMHELFERLRYHKENLPELFINRHFHPNDHAKVLRAYQWLCSLDQPPMRQLLNLGFVEWGFQWLNEPYILEGQIDLWGEVGNEVWLVDYKSGSSRYLEKAMAQLEVYAQPLMEMGYANIKKAIIFPLEEKVFQF